MGKDVANGYSLVTPMFQAIGSAGIDVQELNLIGNAPTDGTVNFQVLNTSRKMTKSFTFYGEGAGMTGDLVGWYDDNGSFEAPDAFKILPGAALMLYVGVDNGGVQVAGQVPDAPAVYAITAAGYYLIGNTMPVDIDIQDLLIGNGAKTDGTVNFQVLSASRKMLKSFTYYGEGAGMTGDLAGWYDDNGSFEAPDTYTLKPGDSVMFYSPSEMTITINPPAVK